MSSLTGSSVPATARLVVRPPGWLSQALLVFRKDLLIEARTGEVVTTSGFFALLVVVTASLSFYGGPKTKHLVAAGVMWLSITFATVLALTRTWQRERDEGALDGLMAAPLSRSAVFAGKATGLWAATFWALTALSLALAVRRNWKREKTDIQQESIEAPKA